MLIDDFLPAFDVSARHSLEIAAPIECAYAAVRRVDLGKSRVTRLLLTLRGLPRLFQAGGRAERDTMTLDDIVRGGFVLLGEQAPKEILLGVVGKFWTPTGGVQRLNPDGFRTFTQAGFAKAAWNFSLEPLGSNVTRLATETRVLCLDAGSRRRFRLYWFFVGLFSGWTRREALRLVKEEAERLSTPA